MPDPETPSPVREGDVLAGKYSVERVLGIGGMGIVVAATHLQLDQKVALKFLLPRALDNPDVVARFAREARAAAKISSEHVARVIDVGTLDTGSPYMVMEYLEGHDLSDVLEKNGPLPAELMVGYVLQACEALAEAHALGIVHRDLKPANLFLAKRPDKRAIVKVLDFGISKAAASTKDAHLTKTQDVMGSPLYMSPEQMTSSRSVDVRSDIWSLGCVMHELLCGGPPFLAETMPELIAAILQRPPSRTSALNPAVPAGLDALIARCLEKDPNARFSNIGDLAVALLPFGPPNSSHSVEKIARVLGKASGAPPPTNPGQPAPVSSWASTAPATSARPTRRMPLLVSIAAFGVLASGGVVFWIARGPVTNGAPLAAQPDVAAPLAPTLTSTPAAVAASEPPKPSVGIIPEVPPPTPASASAVASVVAPRVKPPSTPHAAPAWHPIASATAAAPPPEPAPAATDPKNPMKMDWKQ